MSELGQNEGQEQGKDVPFFDSSKIEDKKDVEHFANVEGAEERAKKAEQAKKAAEKEAQEVHAADIRAASEQLKKQENAETPRKKGGILGFLFGGWHKIVTIVVLLALVVGGVLLVISSIPESEESKLEKDKAAIDLAQSVYVEAEEVRLGGSYDDAKKKFEDALVKCSREEKIFITIKYAEYIAHMEYNRNEAYSMIDSVRGIAQTEIEKEYIESSEYLVNLYTGEM